MTKVSDVQHLIKIDGVIVPHIVSYKIGHSKLWKDSERNMSGELRATLIGIFPKIQLQIGYTTQTEMNGLVSLFDKPFFTVEWFDVATQGMKSAQYYASDYDVELDSKSKCRYKPFSVNLVPVKKRGY